MMETLHQDTFKVLGLGVAHGLMVTSCPTVEEEFVDFPGLIAPRTRFAISSPLPLLLVFAQQAGRPLQHFPSIPPLPNLLPRSARRTSSVGRRQVQARGLASPTSGSAPSSSASSQAPVDVSPIDLPWKELTVARGEYAQMEFARKRQRRQ